MCKQESHSCLPSGQDFLPVGHVKDKIHYSWAFGHDFLCMLNVHFYLRVLRTVICKHIFGVNITISGHEEPANSSTTKTACFASLFLNRLYVLLI